MDHQVKNDSNVNDDNDDSTIGEIEFKDLTHTSSINSVVSYDSDGNAKPKLVVNKDGLLEAWKKPENFDDICKIDKPDDYIDYRSMYTDAIERYFFFNYQESVFKTGFVTDPKYRIHGLCYRKCTVSLEKSEMFELIYARSDRYHMPVPDELLRFILNDEYGIMKKSCEEELLEMQKSTAGIGVYKSKTNVSIPDGYFLADVNDLPSDLDINEYPYNFGIVMKRENVTDKLFFLCCGNNDCRGVGKKPTILDIIIMKKNAKKDYYMPKQVYKPMIPEQKELRYVHIDEHLRLKHWNQLIQIKEFDVNMCHQQKQLDRLSLKETKSDKKDNRKRK